MRRRCRASVERSSAQIGAHLDRREQQEAAVLGEDRPADLRAARQRAAALAAAPAWRSARRETGRPSSCWSVTFMLCVTSSTTTCSNSARSMVTARIAGSSRPAQAPPAPSSQRSRLLLPRRAAACCHARSWQPGRIAAHRGGRAFGVALRRRRRLARSLVGVGQQALRALEVVARVPVVADRGAAPRGSFLRQLDQRDRLAGLRRRRAARPPGASTGWRCCSAPPGPAARSPCRLR